MTEKSMKFLLQLLAWILVLVMPASLLLFAFSDEVLRRKLVLLAAVDAAPFIGALLYLGNQYKDRVPDIRKYAERHPKSFFFLIIVLPALLGFISKNWIY